MTNIKEIIQLFVPPIYYKVKKRLLPKNKEPYNPLPKIERRKQRVVVIGNGPSLTKTVELYKDQLLDSDCIMVNFSVRTALFEQIQPRYYLLTDESGWIDDEGEAVHRFVEAICTKTQWPMYIIMTKAFKKWWAIEEFKKNPNLMLLFDESKWLKYPDEELFPAFAENRLSPPCCTVLTYGVYLALYWDYPETYIVGADTTFTQMVYVGQKDNIVYTIDTHFYNNNDVYPTEIEPEKQGRPYGIDMEHYMDMCHTIFYEYNILARYAKWKGLKVYNASEFSMIDCYERKKLK